MTARAWLRRNRVALIALVALVPAAVLSTAGLAIIDANHTDPPPVPVASGHAVTEFGATWTLRAAQEFPGKGASDNVPVGSALVAVAIEVSPVAGATTSRKVTCGITLDAPAGARRMTWDPLLNPEDYGFQVTPKTVQVCTPRPGKPTFIEMVFLVPRNTLETSGAIVSFAGADHPVRIRLTLHKG